MNKRQFFYFSAVLLCAFIGLSGCQKKTEHTAVQSEGSEGEGTGRSEALPEAGETGEVVLSGAAGEKYPFVNRDSVYINSYDGIVQYDMTGKTVGTYEWPVNGNDEPWLLWTGDSQIIWEYEKTGSKTMVCSTPLQKKKEKGEPDWDQTRELFSLKGEGIDSADGMPFNWQPSSVCMIDDALWFQLQDSGQLCRYVPGAETYQPVKIDGKKRADFTQYAVSFLSDVCDGRLVVHMGSGNPAAGGADYDFGYYDMKTGAYTQMDPHCFGSAAYVADQEQKRVYYQTDLDQGLWMYDLEQDEKTEWISEEAFRSCYEENGLVWDDAYYNDSIFVESEKVYFVKGQADPLIFSYQTEEEKLTFEKELTEMVRRTGYTGVDAEDKYLYILEGKLLLTWWDEESGDVACIIADLADASPKVLSGEEPEQVYFDMIGLGGGTDENEKLAKRLEERIAGNTEEPVSRAELSTAGQPLSVGDQFKLIRKWYLKEHDFSEPDAEPYYAVTDLDHNGRLEIITSTDTQGSGFYTDSQVHQVSADGQSLRVCMNAFRNADGDNTWLYDDIVGRMKTAYVDPKDGTYYYPVYDYASAGWNAGMYWDYGALSFRSGMFARSTYATRGMVYQYKKKKRKWSAYIYVDGTEQKVRPKKLESESYLKKLEKKYFKGFEKRKTAVKWYRAKGKKKTKKLLAGRLKKSYQAFMQEYYADQEAAENQAGQETGGPAASGGRADGNRGKKTDSASAGKSSLAGSASVAQKEINEQLALLAGMRKQWLFAEGGQDTECSYFSVTDLDHNGRLEIWLSTGNQGSGGISRSWCYELSEDGKHLKKCKITKESPESFPKRQGLLSPAAAVRESGSLKTGKDSGEISDDIVYGMDTAYVDRQNGTYAYRVTEGVSGGAGSGSVDCGALTLQNGVIRRSTYATVKISYDEKKKKEAWDIYSYAGGEKQKISRKDFDEYKLADAYFDGYQKKAVNVRWFSLRDKKRAGEKKIKKLLKTSCQAFMGKSVPWSQMHVKLTKEKEKAALEGYRTDSYFDGRVIWMVTTDVRVKGSTAVHKFKKKKLTIEEYVCWECKQSGVNDQIRIREFALADVYGTGRLDLVLHLKNLGGCYLIIHPEHDKKYGFFLSERQFESLCKNGNAYGSGGASSGSWFRLIFSENGIREKTFARKDWGKYWIGKEKVSRQRYEAWEKKHTGDRVGYYTL